MSYKHDAGVASSNHYGFGTAVTYHDDDEDPLGILGGASRGKLGATKSRIGTAGMAVAPPTFGVDCERGDPCEIIDAILRRSKEVRNRVFTQQARILDDFKTENHQLEKVLAQLPPTYSQYLAVCERANSRRKQRKAAKAANADASISHPLNFHLHSAKSNLPPTAGRCSGSESGLAPEALEVGDAPVLETGVLEPDAGGGGQEVWRSAGSERYGEGDNGPPSECMQEGGGAVDVESANKRAEHFADRRWSTRARAGSAPESFIARPSTSYQRTEELHGTGSPRQRRIHETGNRMREEEVPALRRSKVRGRHMVFSLLQAAQVEEQDMEDRYFSCPVSASEDGQRQREAAFRKLDEARIRNAKDLGALLAEYDPRPRKSRREHALNNLRKALPWPNLSHTGSGGRYALSSSAETWRPRPKSSQIRSTKGRSCTNGVENGEYTGDSVLLQSSQEWQDGRYTQREKKESAGGKQMLVVVDGGGGGGDGHGHGHGTHGERCGESKWSNRSKEGERNNDAGSGGGYANHFLDVEQQDTLQEAPHGDRVDGRQRDGGVVKCFATGSDNQNGGGNFSPNNIGDIQRLEASEELCLTGVGPEDAIDGQSIADPDVVQSPTWGPSNSVAVVEKLKEERSVNIGDGEKKIDGDESQGRADIVVANPVGRPTTGRRKKPTLPDPNEVNGTVMADPFNMDHMKDLPGLVGGDDRELSMLVSEAVTYTDPAFPNLEFHRRAAMERAGYFMPGYKPRVNSPGPDAGAYWLARRQSYRVKMTAPAHQQHQRNYSEGKTKQRLGRSLLASKQQHNKATYLADKPLTRQRVRASKGATRARPATTTTTATLTARSTPSGREPGLGTSKSGKKAQKRSLVSSVHALGESCARRGRTSTADGGGSAATGKADKRSSGDGRYMVKTVGEDTREKCNNNGRKNDREGTDDWRREPPTER